MRHFQHVTTLILICSSLLIHVRAFAFLPSVKYSPQGCWNTAVDDDTDTQYYLTTYTCPGIGFAMRQVADLTTVPCSWMCKMSRWLFVTFIGPQRRAGTIACQAHQNYDAIEMAARCLLSCCVMNPNKTIWIVDYATWGLLWWAQLCYARLFALLGSTFDVNIEYYVHRNLHCSILLHLVQPCKHRPL